MSEKREPATFFLGANSPQGFVSRFDQITFPVQDMYTFILKGGPGIGKSTWMHDLCDQLKDQCDDIELIACCSDVNSLDAVVFHDWNVAVLDGTAPHAVGAKRKQA